MTEGKAIVLYLICMCLAGGAMGVVTVLTEPSGEVFAVAVTLIAIAGGIAASEVVSRTMPPEGDQD